LVYSEELTREAREIASMDRFQTYGGVATTTGGQHIRTSIQVS